MTFDRRRLEAVLFDLDGTLLDTAPDMGAALNQLRLEHNLAPLPQSTIRIHVSHGASGLVRLGFPGSSTAMHAELVARFLVLYQERLAHATRPFDEVPVLLDALEAAGIRWGVVTNKPARFTDPLLLALELDTRAHVVVSGDTLPERKPSPAPLLYAAQRMKVLSAHCMYVGDALRDMQAARAAGMLAIGARFGYIDPAELPDEWPADGWIESPIGLLEWIERHA
jgi:phosphoglycolate phosphatase